MNWELRYSEIDFENVYKMDDQNKVVKATIKMIVKRSIIEIEAVLSEHFSLRITRSANLS